MSDSTSERSYLESSLAGFLELVSGAAPAPAGGSVAAVTAALGASLCVKAARLSTSEMPDALDIAAALEQLRDRAGLLCQADADAYDLVVVATRQSSATNPQDRRRAVAEALSHACDVPAEVVRIAARVAELAARIAQDGNPNLLGDVVTAALLAECAAQSATALIGINLEGVSGDERPAQAAQLLEETVRSSSSARRARPRA